LLDAELLIMWNNFLHNTLERLFCRVTVSPGMSIDMNWYGIRTLQLLGLAKSIKLVRLTGQTVESESA
jgi:hypothetical protein